MVLDAVYKMILAVFLITTLSLGLRSRLRFIIPYFHVQTQIFIMIPLLLLDSYLQLDSLITNITLVIYQINDKMNPTLMN